MRIMSFCSIIFLLLSVSVYGGELPDEPHIVVNGTSQVSAVPDILRMSLNITEISREVEQARSSVEDRSSRLIHTLIKSIGLEKKDITSARLQITPHYNWSNKAQVYAGTEVSRVLEIILRDLRKYNDMLKAVIDAGVARINSTTLESSEEKKLRAVALQSAVADAREKALLLVESFPEQVGSVYSISASPSRPGLRRARYQVAKHAERDSFEPGVIEISESVQVIFYLTK